MLDIYCYQATSDRPVRAVLYGGDRDCSERRRQREDDGLPVHDAPSSWFRPPARLSASRGCMAPDSRTGPPGGGLREGVRQQSPGFIAALRLARSSTAG